MKNLFTIFLFFSFVSNAFSQKVSAVTDKNVILIGEQVQLSLKAVFPDERQVQWFKIDSIPGFEILNENDAETTYTNEEITITQDLVITSWDSGNYRIPPFRLGRIGTKSIDIRVSFTEMDPNKPYNEIKDILPVERPKSSKWYWYLIFVAVLVALFLLFFPSSKTNNSDQEPVVEDPYADAVDQLNRLELSETPDPKKFYTELVYIFRQYLHRRKNIQSFSKTTEDLAQQIKGLQLNDEEYSELVQILQLSDMVKFAKYIPQQEEKEKSFITIRQTIDTIEKLPNAV